MRTTMFVTIPLLLVACTEEPVAPSARPQGPSFDASQGAVVHRVSAGGPDICEAFGAHPGCDGNYSLVAMELADGSVRGELQDVWGSGGQPGVHADVTCLHIQAAPNPLFTDAWIGGVVTSPTSLAGLPVITRVRDRGTSNNDLDDLVGRVLVNPEVNHGISADCQDHPPFAFAPARGQVTIK